MKTPKLTLKYECVCGCEREFEATQQGVIICDCGNEYEIKVGLYETKSFQCKHENLEGDLYLSNPPKKRCLDCKELIK